MKLSYVGYEFEVPWTDLDEARTKVIGGNKAIIVFHTGNVLSVWSGPPHELRDAILREWEMEPETFANIYGRDALQSDYKFMHNILEATPQGISIFGLTEAGGRPIDVALSQGDLLARRSQLRDFCPPRRRVPRVSVWLAASAPKAAKRRVVPGGRAPGPHVWAEAGRSRDHHTGGRQSRDPDHPSCPGRTRRSCGAEFFHRNPQVKS